MKISFFLLCLSFSTIAFSNTTIVLTCDHSSENNWPLGGKPYVNLTLETNSRGKILAALVDGEKVEVNAAGDTLIKAPYSTSSFYGPQTYFVNESNLTQVRLGDEVEVVKESDNYLAYYSEELQCKRTF